MIQSILDVNNSILGCLKCNIVYHMVSDSCYTPMCKKCDGDLSYFNHDYDSGEVQHDSWWSSNGATKEKIEPDHISKNNKGENNY